MSARICLRVSYATNSACTIPTGTDCNTPEGMLLYDVGDLSLVA
ncbi:hypothetical protein SCG7086_BI_00120, partial [Chlamydiales bacterium SCGC AG-110-P3]